MKVTAALGYFGVASVASYFLSLFTLELGYTALEYSSASSNAFAGDSVCTQDAKTSKEARGTVAVLLDNCGVRKTRRMQNSSNDCFKLMLKGLAVTFERSIPRSIVTEQYPRERQMGGRGLSAFFSSGCGASIAARPAQQ